MSTKSVTSAIKRMLPLLDRIIVLKEEPAAISEGGILIPEKARKVLRGKVVAVGPGIKNDEGKYIPLTIKVGDDVLLPHYNYSKVALEDDKEYYIFRESDIIAKFL